MHQVEVEVVETGGARHVGSADGLVAIVDAPQRLELVLLEALHADGQAIDAEAAIAPELGLLEGAGVGFQGDFDVRRERDTPLYALKQPGEGAVGKQAGCAATEEY